MEKDLTKFIKEALKKDHLYTNDEIIYLKQQLREMKSIISQNNKKNSKGFGN